MKSYFYILECHDKSYYYGSTTDISKRLQYHQSGRVNSTKSKLTVKLLYQEQYNSYKKANQREYQVKLWKNRARVDKLIEDQGAIV